jgi:hypothetical protein
VRFRAFTLPPRNNAPVSPVTPSVELTRVNRVFALDDAYLPKTSIFSWTGSAPLAVDGASFELRIPRR